MMYDVNALDVAGPVRAFERGATILEIFAERQACAHAMIAQSDANLLDSVRRRKALDNAEQHKNRQCDAKKRAKRADKKRSAYADKRGGRVRAYRKAAA